MATLSGNYVQDTSTLTNFKSWAMAISTAFSTFGWVQTADTGQVNWSTISAVPSSTYVYEIWKANDALAASMPIYVKMEYGQSTSSVGFRITVGTGSNGSGTISGITISSAPWQVNNLTTNQGATTFPCYFSGTAGEIRVLMWSNPTASPNTTCFFGIERSKDSSGAMTASYITVLYGSANSLTTSAQQSLSASAVGLRHTGILGIGLDSGAGTGNENGTVAAFPIFPTFGQVGNPMLGYMSAFAIDVAAGSIVTVSSFYGGSHTFIPIPNCSPVFSGRSSSQANIMGLMRFE